MSLASKEEHKVALDVAAWTFNIVTSVGIIIVNKALMATYGFTFATTLTGLHFLATTLMTLVLKRYGYIQSSPLPVSDLLKFVLYANFSIVGMNVSLMWNSVGFYQIAKLSMIPVSCFLEVVLDNVQYSRDTKLSILVVLLGVAICTVTDMSVNVKGFVAAFVAVWSTSLQQYIFIGLSCAIAIGTNLSQFICIGRFTAVSFQVLGHMKTIFVLTLGFLFFGKEGLNLHVIVGMMVAIVGMIWYGHASSQPGGKERTLPTHKPEEEIGLVKSNELDGKI